MDATTSEPAHRKRSMLENVTTTIAIGLAGAAILKDIAESTGNRFLHGEVVGLVPYDFRRPSMRRIRDGVWDPSGPVLKPQVFGVGWTLNLGALLTRARPRT